MKNQLLTLVAIAGIFALPRATTGQLAESRRLQPQSASVSADSVLSADGVKIQYEVAGQGEPALVFIHGWSCDRSYWKAQLEHFSKSHRVVALDLGGHGESGLNRNDWTIRLFAEDVRAVVDALRLSRVVLIGHSLGGCVALEAAALTPDKTVAIIPVESLTSVLPKEQREAAFSKLSAGLRADFRKTTTEFARTAFFTPRSDPRLVARVTEDMASAPPNVGSSAMENLLAYIGREGEGETFSKIKAPMHLVNADLVPTDLAYWRKYKPETRLTVMPGAGHFVMLENPAEFNQRLDEVLRPLSPAPRK